MSSEEQERNFLLDDLILETVQRSSLIRNTKIVFITILTGLCFLQFFITNFPSEESVYFYIGYIATPLLIASAVALIIFLVLKNKRIEAKALIKLFKRP